MQIGFLLLKINLNISDLLILTILAVGKLCWLATYAWYGGDLLCKLFNFMSMFALYISSNIVVCIALDRLRNVLGASKIRRGKSTVSIYFTFNFHILFFWGGGWEYNFIKGFISYRNEIFDFHFNEEKRKKF